MPNELTLAQSAGQTIHEYRKSTRKMRWWYEHLADYMIANPRATQNEMGVYFGRSPGTISTVINTDAFKAYLRQRRAAYETQLDASVRQKMLKVADGGLDLILEQFEKKRDTIPIEILQKSVETSLKSLGYGAPSPTHGVQVNVNAGNSVTVPVSMADLEAARTALRASQTPSPPVIEGEIVDDD